MSYKAAAVTNAPRPYLMVFDIIQLNDIINSDIKIDSSFFHFRERVFIQNSNIHELKFFILFLHIVPVLLSPQDRLRDGNKPLSF